MVTDPNAHLMGEEIKPMMKCGHVANAVRKLNGGEEVPVCVICAGIDTGASEIDESPPDLSKRYAKCGYKRKRNGTLHGPAVRSDKDKLAFFEHLPDEEFDDYYCGCWGWD